MTAAYAADIHVAAIDGTVHAVVIDVTAVRVTADQVTVVRTSAVVGPADHLTAIAIADVA